MRLVGRELAEEFVFIDRAAQGVAYGAEPVHGSPGQDAHIVLVVADHHRHLGNGSVEKGVVEILCQDLPVRMRGQHHEALPVGRVLARNAENSLGGGGAHLLEGRQAGVVHQGFPLVVVERLRDVVRRSKAAEADPAAALDDGLGQEVLRQRGDKECLHAHRSGALAKDGDVVRVAAESGDVVMNPLQGGDLVHGAVVPGLALFGRQFGVAQEAEGTQPVVDGHEDHPAACPGVTVHGHFMAVSVHVSASVDPHGYGQPGRFLADRTRGRPDIQVQAVFTLLRRAFPVELVPVERPRGVARLPGNGAEVGALPHSLPGRDGLRGLPAEVPHRRCRIGNPLINNDFAGIAEDPFDLSAGDGKNRISGCATGGHEQAAEQEEGSFFHIIQRYE